MKDCYLRVFRIMEASVEEEEADREKRASLTDPYYYAATYPDIFPPIAKQDFRLECEIKGWKFDIFMVHFDGLRQVKKSSPAKFVNCENEYRKRPWDTSLDIDKHILGWTNKVRKANSGKLTCAEDVGLAYFVSSFSTKMMGLPLMGFGYLPFVFLHPPSQYYQKAFIRKI